VNVFEMRAGSILVFKTTAPVNLLSNAMQIVSVAQQMGQITVAALKPGQATLTLTVGALICTLTVTVL
jgi:hypothetical protein